MSRTDWAVFGCRIVALYLGIFAVILATGPLAQVDIYRSNYVGVPITWSVVGNVGPLVAQLLAAVLLWVFAPKLVRAAFGPEESPIVNAVGLAAVAAFLVGVTIFFTRLPAAVAYLSYLQPLPKGIARSGGPAGLLSGGSLGGQFPWPPVIADLIRIAIAVLLMMGAHRLTKLPSIILPRTASRKEEM